MLATSILRRLPKFAPPSYRLPLRAAAARLEGGEAELRHLSEISPCRGSAVDVGANIGLYSYALSKLHEKVYAFEPAADLTRDLAAWNPGNIKIINSGLSDSERAATLFVPVLKGVALDGYGSLTTGNLANPDSHIEKPISLRSLDSFRLSNVTFIKIDVEGHEVATLKGATETFRRERPVVLIEVTTHTMQTVTDFFSTQNYRRTHLSELLGVESEWWNLIFLPA
jgi:FkbM family methyltransferase